MNTNAAPLQADSIIGPYPYRISKPVRQVQGRMAEIYQATVENDAGNYVVAIKLANIRNQRTGEFYLNALQNEVQQLLHLHHPNIVRLLPILTREGSDPDLSGIAQSELPEQPWFAVLEWLPGGSLATLIESNPRGAPLWMVAEIGYALASALDYLHSHGLVHMDVKPRNIMFRRPFSAQTGGETVLIDFGSTRRDGESELDVRTTYEVSAYLPPEWVKTARQSLAQAHPGIDIYALGVTLYQLLTGRLPFAAERAALEAAILDANVTPPSNLLTAARGPLRDVVHDLDDILMAALNPNQTQRCNTQMLVDSLGQIRHRLSSPALGARPTVPDPGECPPNRLRLWMGHMLCLGLGVGLGIGGAFAYINGPVIRPGVSPSPTWTTTVTPSPTWTPTLTPTATGTATPAPTASATSTPPPSPTPTFTFTPQPASLPTSTSFVLATPRPTGTATTQQ